MINEQLTAPAEHRTGDEESGDAAVMQTHARAPYFAYAAALNAMDLADDPEEDRHGD